VEPRQANRRNLHRRSLVLAFGGLWRAREREPIMGVWGLCPQRGPGAESLVRRSGGGAGFAPQKLNTTVHFISQFSPNFDVILVKSKFL